MNDTKKTDTTENTTAASVGQYTADQAYGAHENQRFGNLPENPKTPDHLPQPGDPSLDESNSKLLAHHTPNMPEGVVPAFVRVHDEVVGDYLRAGWHIATEEDIKARDEAATDTTKGDASAE